MVEKREIFGMDLLLLLLYAPGKSNKMNEPVIGMTRLQKELFLIQKLLQDKGIKYKYPFMPFNLGPFSKDLCRDIEWLKHENVIKEKIVESRYKGICRIYKLTKKGLRRATQLLTNHKIVNEIYPLIKEVKKQYNDMDIVSLVELTHNLFPEYVKKLTG